jgi:hypothetical protein
MKNPSQRRKRDQGPELKLRHDDLGDAFPNDWLEAVIIFTALVFISGGAYFMYHLAQQMPVVN